MQRIHHEADLDHLRRSAQAYAVMAAWNHAGIFRALADGSPRQPEELPGNPRAIRVSAPLLAHLGLLIQHGERWALSGTGQALYGAGLIGGSAENALGDLSRLDAVLAEGGPVRGPDGTSRVSEGGVRVADREGSRAFLDWLHRRSESAAHSVMRWVQPHLPPAGHVLDLGGGHGRYAHAFVEAGFSATLFDVPLSIELTRERCGNALEYRAGDFMQDALGGPYAAALLSNIVHGLGPEENRTLLRRLRPALQPDGLLVIKDMLLDDLGTDPENAVFFHLTMLMYTRGGRSYSAAELREMCEDEGYTFADLVQVRDEGFSLLMLKAPA